jgi:simple sugar transport system permease protein
VSPLAGKALAGDAQIGEYFRVFVAYAVITVALVLHAWQSARAAREARRDAV